MTDAWAQIIVSLIGASVTIYIAWRNHKLNKENEELKEELNDVAYKININLLDANKLQSILTDLMKNTRVERFVMFVAENGGKKPLTFTTAIFEEHKNNMYLMFSMGATSKYVKFRFDNPYLHMLQYIEATHEGMFFRVDDMPESKLKSIYRNEQIKQSGVFFHRREKLTEDKHVILYCSFATHNEQDYTPEEKTLIQLAANQISNLEIKIERHE